MSGQRYSENAAHVKHPHRSEPDVAPMLGSEHWPLLDPGRYEAIFTRAERRAVFKRQQIVLWFQLLGREGYPVAELFSAWSLRLDGSVAPAGKYARTWRLVAGRRPRRGERMSTAIFRHRVLDVEVRTVQHDQKQRPLAEADQYSVVDRIVGVAAGGRPR